MNLIDLIIIIFAFIFLVLIILQKLTKVPTLISKNKTTYSAHRERPEKALFSSKYGLAGKPDFILHTKDGLLPLEIKNSKRPNKPYLSHVMQLMSYCLLIEETKGVKPKYGLIQYKGRKAFSVPYTEKMKFSLIKTMQEMRNCINSGKYPKPIKNYKCEGCGYQQDCFGS